ncbi:MAG: hypothetical protein ACJAYU_003498 [Bradymonadia bacterium]|jgi:uncharacterized protein YjbI with pentapeptide repeats
MLVRLSIFFLSLSLFGCVGDSESSNIERCVPGRVAACACPGGVAGTQLCSDDGRFDSCVCGEVVADAGGDAPAEGDVIEDVASDVASDAPQADVTERDVDSTDTESDVEPDIPEPDIGPTTLPLGAPCGADGECRSESCVAFSEGSFCTEACVGSCVLDEWVCFNRVCTPEAHCEVDRGEDGVGPGCADARCGGCPEFSLCSEFEFGRYECVCDTGFELEEFTTCVDVDECELEIADCPEGRLCENTDGGFVCGCGVGYFGADCAECPGGADNVCFGRGTCDDGNEGTGACECEPRYGGELCDQECFEADVVDCADADLAEANLSGRDLSFGDFSRAILDDLNVSTAILTEAILDDVSAIATRFIEADLTMASLSGGDFTDASFRDGVLSSTAGTEIVMAGAILIDATADDIIWSGVTLTGADFSRASMLRANLSDAVARETVFDLVDASYGDARGADFTDASMVEFGFFAGFATGTDFTRVILAEANLGEANLSTSVMRNADLSEVSAALANLRDCDLFGAIFNGANLAGAILTDADGTQADFTNANLSGANLTDMDLTNGILTGASLEGATLTGVVWSNTMCPDGTNSTDNGDTCEGHFLP